MTGLTDHAVTSTSLSHFFECCLDKFEGYINTISTPNKLNTCDLGPDKQCIQMNSDKFTAKANACKLYMHCIRIHAVTFQNTAVAHLAVFAFMCADGDVLAVRCVCRA